MSTKILLVPSSFVPIKGGVQKNTFALARHFSESGLEVNVLTKMYSGLPNIDTIDGIRIYRVPFYVFRGTLLSLFAFLYRGQVAFLKSLKIIKKVKPDIINVHFVGANSFFILLTNYFIKTKLVVTLHGTIEAPDPDLHKTEGYWEATILNWTAKKLLRKADHIIGVSSSLVEKAKSFVPEIRNKCSVIHVGIGGDEFVSRDQRASGKSILAMGRLVHEKGFDILLKAFSRIAIKYPGLAITLAGDGVEREKLKNLALGLGMEKRVRFFGVFADNDVMDLLAECIFLVVPSRNEGFPTVILEAMAAGKAIIATSVGGIPEAIEHCENGILVKGENPDSLAESMDYLLSHPELCQRMGERGREQVKKFGWEVISKQYLKIYENIIGSGDG